MPLAISNAALESTLGLFVVLPYFPRYGFGDGCAETLPGAPRKPLSDDAGGSKSMLISILKLAVEVEVSGSWGVLPLTASTYR